MFPLGDFYAPFGGLSPWMMGLEDCEGLLNPPEGQEGDRGKVPRVSFSEYPASLGAGRMRGVLPAGISAAGRGECG